MSDDRRNRESALRSGPFDRRAEPEVESTSRERRTQDPTSSVMTRSWARSSEYYDWMDTHTLCANVDAWH